MNNYQATEADYAEAFGMTVEEFASESAQNDDQLQEGQGDTQPPECAAEGTGAAAEGENGGAEQSQVEDQQAERTEMPPKERSVWAERRRDWEAREEQAREAAAQARVDKVFADMFKGQLSPYTGKPITTEAEFREYEAERNRRQQEAQLQKAGIDPKTIQGMVDQQLAPFRQQMEAAQLSAIQERARMVNARAEAAIGAALQKITAMDPEVKTLEDIAKMPTADKFNDYVQKGIGMEDAFYLANRQAIDARRMAAARTATQNQMAGKGHLNPVGGVSGKTPVQVSKAEMDAYRAFMPDATDAEIQAAYEAERKK